MKIYYFFISIHKTKWTFRHRKEVTVPRAHTYLSNAVQESEISSLVKHLLVTFLTRIPFRFYSENRTCHRSLHFPLLIPSRLWSLSLEISTPGAMKLINMHHTHLSIFHLLRWLSYEMWHQIKTIWMCT